MNASEYWATTAEAVMSNMRIEYEEDEDEYSKHKYGLCHFCGHGLDDRSDFVVYEDDPFGMVFLCNGCGY